MAQRPPSIVQLPSTRVCECPKCWKESDSRHAKSSVVYEGHNLHDEVRCSADGRYMYAFTLQSELLVADLLHNTRKLLQSGQKWRAHDEISEFLVVNSKTLLVRSLRRGFVGLQLIRLREGGDRYERVRLYRSTRIGYPTFGFAEIRGENVDVKRAVLGNREDSGYLFFNVDIDQPQAEVDHRNERFDTVFSSAQMSTDGREMYAVAPVTPNVLFVYSLEQQEWRMEPLDCEVMRGKVILGETIRPDQTMYLQGYKRVGSRFHWFLFRCNLATKAWEEVPIDAEDSPLAQLSA
ncbi:hypothetical protein M3Y99_01325300 [Aphelenchoides fujianensis]|nr:hypothetical protein M3Y99_01325300 [Aphelenchoides fujianensis]